MIEDDDTASARWERSGPDGESASKPGLVTQLRLAKDDGTLFSEAERAVPLMVIVNGEDEILVPPTLTVGRFRDTRQDAGAGTNGWKSSHRVLDITPPLMLVEGMRLEILMGDATLSVLAERYVRDVNHSEAVAWFEANARSKDYPARWYGTAEADVMRAKIDTLVQQARDEGLRPNFVTLVDEIGQMFDTTCRACDSDEPERGPFNAQLLTKRDEATSVLYFAFPIVCGICSESEEALADLIQEIWDRGRGLDS